MPSEVVPGTSRRDFDAFCDAMSSRSEELCEAQALLARALDLIGEATRRANTDGDLGRPPAPDSTEVAEVEKRLSAQLGSTVAPTEIHDVVADEYAKLAEAARIRTYLPLLVEHAADRRLRAEAPARPQGS
jgi:hypothetical protein